MGLAVKVAASCGAYHSSHCTWLWFGSEDLYRIQLREDKVCLSAKLPDVMPHRDLENRSSFSSRLGHRPCENNPKSEADGVEGMQSTFLLVCQCPIAFKLLPL